MSSNISEYRFTDLVDVKEFEKVLKDFFKLASIPSVLIDTNGEVLIQIGWDNEFSKFHNIDLCSIKDKIISNKKIDTRLYYKKSKDGFFHESTKHIIVENRYIGSLYMGEFLFESPNIDKFKKIAKKHHFNEKAYIQAIKKLTITNKEKIEALMDRIVNIASIMANNSLSKIRENDLKNDLMVNKEKTIEFKDLLKYSPVGIGWSNNVGDIEYINEKFIELFGYLLDDIPNIETWYKKAFPDDKYRDLVIAQWLKATYAAKGKNSDPPDIEVDITCKNGLIRHVLLRLRWIDDKRLVIFNDITKHWEIEQRNQAHDSMLAMIAKGKSLFEILNAIVKLIELEDKASKCSILLLDNEGEHLLTGAAPSLPFFYNEAVNGMKIGEGVGSCGSAAYLKKRVIVENVTTHKYWKPYLELAQKAKIKACWSEPIVSSQGKVLGTFAIYHSKISRPSNEDMERISFAANLAAIAIERSYALEKLQKQAYSDYLTGLANRRSFFNISKKEIIRHRRYGTDVSIIMFDIDSFKEINDKYGHAVGDLVLKNIAQTSVKILREIDIIGRIGGEEFAILLPQTSKSEAKKTAERLRKKIENQKVTLEDGTHLQYKASFGVFGTGSTSFSIDDMLKKADDALYKAKKTGKNKVCVSL